MSSESTKVQILPGARADNRIRLLELLLATDIAYIAARVVKWSNDGKLVIKTGGDSCLVCTASGGRDRLIKPDPNDPYALQPKDPSTWTGEQKFAVTHIALRFQRRDADLRLILEQMKKVEMEKGGRSRYHRTDVEQTMDVSHTCNVNHDKRNEVCIVEDHLKVHLHGDNLKRRFCISKYAIICGNCPSNPVRLECPHSDPCTIPMDQVVTITLSELAAKAQQGMEEDD